ncbi:Por secretion system C-terminal sorting domain-containing protein [Soonwooa buanensis]|uniref:Por secretion system C-terminal sorting domain-containing protein n=1 Tax=Soonwooa buanensis TaxID=619805 RepID=A0A1T5EU50_9FLAO|nr:YDG domain-containing protein [Soonwooa buanensis]SKB87411.1 Por secretion system C-terminal sorting domain-containing protein [Soonwooa buanensis]
MKTHLYSLKLFLFVLLASFSVKGWGQLTLGTSPYQQNFDGIESGLPTGWTISNGATNTTLGTSATLTTTKTKWSSTASQFANFASATSLVSTSTEIQQENSTNRALGVRQSGSFGDPGASFMLRIANTTGKSNFNLSFKMQSLDAATGRTVTWKVQYGLGNNPTSFVDLTTVPTTFATSSTWGSTNVSVALPAAVSNVTQNVWIRIVALSASTGTGGRPTSAIDDVSLSWSSATTSILDVTPAGPLSFVAINNSPASTSQDVVINGSNLTPISAQQYVDAILESYSNSATEHFEFSIDGGTTYTNWEELPIVSGTINKTLKVRLKANQSIGTYTDKIVFTYTGTTAPFTIIKELVLNASVTGAKLTATPATLSGFTYIYGSGPSLVQSFTLTGAGLSGTGSASLLPGNHWEISSDNGVSWHSYADNGITLNNYAGTSQTIQVRLKKGLDFGTYDNGSNDIVAITYSGSGVTSNDVSLSGNVVKKALTVENLTVENKTYDGNNDATIGGTATLGGVVDSDDVSLVGTATGTFDTKNVGNDKIVTINGFSLVGTKASNYTLTQPTKTANIIVKNITISTPIIAPKTYDGTTTTGTITLGTITGLVGSETLGVTAVGNYTDANVGVDKTANIVYTTADGNNGGLKNNYSTLSDATALGDITKAEQVITMLGTLTKYLGNPDFSPATSTSSANPITYTSSNSAVATVVNNQIHLVAIGSTVIKASQAGSDNYNAATDKEMNLTVEVNKDVYRSNKSGNWNDPTTWFASSDGLTGWTQATSAPAANNVVYIQSSHNVTLTQNESCKDLHISKGTSSSNPTLGKVILDVYSLDLYGKLRTYYASIGGIPGTSSTNGYSVYPFTANTGGRLNVVGTSRNLTVSGEWGAMITTPAPASGFMPVEINMNNGETLFLNTSVKFSDLKVVSGNVDAKTNTISVDQGTSTSISPNISIESGATVISSATSTNNKVFQATGTKAGGDLTLNGHLVLKGANPFISMKSITFNGVVEYANLGDQNFIAVDGTGAVPVSTYYNLTISGSGVKTATGTTTVNNIVNVVAGELKLPRTNNNVAANNVLVAKKGVNVAAGALLTLENNSTLMQDTDAVNNGNVIVNREATVPSTQYNIWSSPVKAQKLYELYGTAGSVPAGTVMEYITKSDIFKPIVNPNVTSDFAKGYSAKGLADNASGAVTAVFKGVPNNGEPSVPLVLSVEGNRFNAVGNPYPSNLDLNILYADNTSSNVSGIKNITNLVRFWDNTNNNITWQQGSSYSGNNYAIYNLDAELGVPATGAASGGDPTKIPDGIVKPGQGFMVRANTSGDKVLKFNNGQRLASAHANTPYYKNSSNKDRFWLALETPGAIVNTIAIAYNDLATNNNDIYDTSILDANNSDLFYSLSDNQYKQAIQSRKGGFADTDAVKLGAKYYKAGTHKIKVIKKDGVFEGGQNIYLHDKVLNKYIDLTTEAYSFDASASSNDTRFEIVYKPGAVLGTVDTQSKDAVIVYKTSDAFVVLSKADAITKVELYDMNGRLIQVNDKAAKEQKLSHETLSNGAYLLKISRGQNVEVKKVLK